MRNLSPSLLAAQLSPSREGVVSVVFRNKNLDWQTIYSGADEESYHAAAFAGDGSMVRARLGTVVDSRKLYCQRVADPGESSDFSQWTYTGEYNAVAVAAAAIGAEVSVLWIKSDRGIRRIKSIDYGATFGSTELIDYSPTTSCGGLAAAYKPNGDLAVFFADQSTVYVKKCIDSVWQARAAWNKTSGAILGLSCVYDGDWNLVVTGQDVSGNYRLWSLVYGDGLTLPAGTWVNLVEIAASPSAESYDFRQAFLDKDEVYRCAYVEKFSGSEAYSRVYLTSTVPGAAFDAGLWTEPQPLDITGDYGASVTHYAEALWLSSANSVRRAILDVAYNDLTASVVAADMVLAESDGRITLELDNANGDLPPVTLGDELAISPGYVTDSGAESSEGLSFVVNRIERRNGYVMIEASDAWARLRSWKAKNQLRWNASTASTSIKDIVAWLLGRVGLRLEVVSASAAITSLCPDFSLNPGADAFSAVRRLLSLVPDILFIEGDIAYLKNPLPDEAAVYSYGLSHSTFDCRAAALLRESSMASTACEITVPTNCGQQLYDVVEVTDEGAGLAAAKYRVTGIDLDYRPSEGKYEMKLKLGGV
jgi:hypothetical protein